MKRACSSKRTVHSQHLENNTLSFSVGLKPTTHVVKWWVCWLAGALSPIHHTGLHQGHGKQRTLLTGLTVTWGLADSDMGTGRQWHGDCQTVTRGLSESDMGLSDSDTGTGRQWQGDSIFNKFQFMDTVWRQPCSAHSTVHNAVNTVHNAVHTVHNEVYTVHNEVHNLHTCKSCTIWTRGHKIWLSPVINNLDYHKYSIQFQLHKTKNSNTTKWVLHLSEHFSLCVRSKLVEWIVFTVLSVFYTTNGNIFLRNQDIYMDMVLTAFLKNLASRKFCKT